MKSKFSILMSSSLLIIVAFALGFTAARMLDRPRDDSALLSQPTIYFPDGKVLIAHAGGVVGKRTYTNSREAMDNSAAQGFTFIELDFRLAKNDDLILLHRKPTDTIKGPITEAELPETGEAFVSAKMAGGLTTMSLETLLMWMKDNPNIYIVTDVKTENLAALQRIKDLAGKDAARFIPQIYYPKQYHEVKALGYENIILTVYYLGDPLEISVEDLGDFAREHPLLALTMPESWFGEDTFERLGETDVPVFLHTTNSHKSATRYFASGVKGLYTDFITPKWVIDNQKNF